MISGDRSATGENRTSMAQGRSRVCRSRVCGRHMALTGCGKTSCKIRCRFDFLRPEQARRPVMRGRDYQRGHLGGYVNPEAMVPPDQPLRTIRPLVNAALVRLSPDFDEIYALTGRPSIPPEQLLRALLLQAFFTVRSERQLMEQLRYNILFRWFVGL